MELKHDTFINFNDEYSFSTLTGSCLRRYLESKGVKCIDNYDTGRNGLVITATGYKVSTNGYTLKI